MGDCIRIQAQAVLFHNDLASIEQTVEALANAARYARERRGLRSWSYTRSCRHPETETFPVPDDTQIQPPKGATVYEDSQSRTEFGSWRYIKYLAPNWRQRKRKRSAA